VGAGIPSYLMNASHLLFAFLVGACTLGAVALLLSLLVGAWRAGQKVMD
jgi:hypothetical protein